MTDNSGRHQAAAVGAGLALSVGGLTAASVITLALSSVAGAAGLPLAKESVVTLLLTTIGTDIGLVAVGWGYLSHRDLGWEYVKARRPTRDDLKIAVVGLVCLLALLQITSLAMRWLGIEVADNSVAIAVQSNPEATFAMVVASFLLVGPSEEFLYRGVIQSRMSESFDTVPAIVVTAVVFGASHYLALVGSSGGKVANVVILSLLALVFGVVYERTDSIAAPVLMHGAYNSLLFLAVYVGGA